MNQSNTNKNQTKGPVLVKKSNPNPSNKGSISTLNLALMITFFCGFIIGIGYILYKINIG